MSETCHFFRRYKPCDSPKTVRIISLICALLQTFLQTNVSFERGCLSGLGLCHLGFMPRYLNDHPQYFPLGSESNFCERCSSGIGEA